MTALVSPPVQQSDRPQNSRRGFLRILAALAPTVALSGVPAPAVALPQGPDEDPALLAIGRRAAELDQQWEIAHEAQLEANRIFADLREPWPAAVFVERGDAVVTPGTEDRYVFTVEWLRSLVAERPSRAPGGRALRYKLKLAEAYEAKLVAARKTAGTVEAYQRLTALNAEIDRLAEEAFQFEPRTRAGLHVLAQAFLVAHGPNDDDHRCLWLEARRPLALAQAVIRLLDPEETA